MPDSKKVVITGGSGLIGRALAESLAAAGHQVRITSRNPALVSGLDLGVEARSWDGVSAGSLQPVLEGMDAVVHLAGENIAAGRWTDTRKREILESRVQSTRAVVEAISEAESRPKILMQASAVGVYGSTGDEVVDESSIGARDFLARVCEAWEREGAIIEKAGIRRVVLRTGVVLSGKGGAMKKMLLPFRLGLGGRLGDGRQWFPWIHVADEVGAIRFLLEDEGARGEFNLTAPEPVTNRKFTMALASALRRPAVLPVPAFALRLILGEMAALLLEGQRAVPSRLLEAGYEFLFPGIEAALADLLDQDTRSMG